MLASQFAAPTPEAQAQANTRPGAVPRCVRGFLPSALLSFQATWTDTCTLLLTPPHLHPGNHCNCGAYAPTVQCAIASTNLWPPLFLHSLNIY